MSEWQPIETAPKSENTAILIYREPPLGNFKWPILVARWNPRDEQFAALPNGTPKIEDAVAWMPLPESYSTDAEKPHIEKPQTNADRIRSMTDEELLDFLCSIETYEQGSVKTIEGGVAMCSVTEVEQWLKAESEG